MQRMNSIDSWPEHDYPQEFKNSPNIFDVVLHEDSSASLLQYVDDLLIAAETLETCKAATKELLKIWGDLGYVSKEGSTLPDWGNLLEVHIRGVVVVGRWQSKAKIETTLRVSKPSNCWEAREFPGPTGFCRLWIPGLPELSWLLYEGTRGGKTPLNSTTQIKKAFKWN